MQLWKLEQWGEELIINGIGIREPRVQQRTMDFKKVNYDRCSRDHHGKKAHFKCLYVLLHQHVALNASQMKEKEDVAIVPKE